MAMQYVKWQCISVFKFTFSYTYVQHLVQNENETEIQLYNLNLPFSTLVLIFKLKTYFKAFKLQNENKIYYPN